MPQHKATVEPALTPHKTQLVQAGLRYLANHDRDRALELNGVGFNKSDSDIGHSLAERSRLTPLQATVGYRLCRRYRGQLPEWMRADLGLGGASA